MAEQNNREIIVDTLIEIIEKNGFSHQVLQQVLTRYQYLPKEQRGFITRVVQGTLEYQIAIDYVLQQFSKTPLKKMKPFIRTLLRSSVYQILLLEHIPDAAVCNEAVKLAKKRGFSQLSGFVNGVLRNIARQKETIQYPNLWTAYGIPDFIGELWVKEYGMKKTEEMVKGFVEESATWIRINPQNTTKEKLKHQLEAQGMVVTEVEGIEEALGISHYDYLQKIPEFLAGDFYVQDISSMELGHCVPVASGQRILDVCAAPGGKALHFAEKLQGSGVVEARDLTESKLLLLEENIKKSQLTNIQLKQWDATVLDKESIEDWDVVIADLPCSGLGVLGKKPDMKTRITMEQILELSQLQREILQVVQQYVAKSGILVYSTCTVTKEENDENVEWFLQQFPQFQLQEQKQLFPGEGKRDGFFWAIFQKKG